MKKIYDKINEQIMEAMDSDTLIWNQPFIQDAFMKPPINKISQKEYRGINVPLLAIHMYKNGFKSNEYITFNQAKKLGGKIKKGSKSQFITFFTFIKKEDKETGKEKSIPILKMFFVFNMEQTEGIDYEIPVKTVTEKMNPIQACENIVNDYKLLSKIEFKHASGSAYYSPSGDYINIPPEEDFINIENYYNVTFHEMVHSTGHETRLNRKELKTLGKDHEYSKEELVAEVGASYLSNICGIEQKTIENSKAYIQSWFKALKKDQTLLLSAFNRAEKAVNLILQK